MLLLLIEIKSLCGLLLNTGEFGAELIRIWLLVEADAVDSGRDVPLFDGLRSLSLDFRSLYAVLTPRPPCFT